MDVWMRSRAPRSPDPAIVLVGIERADLERAERLRPADCACQTIPRNEIGEAIHLIRAAGAKVIAVDLALERICPHPGHDGPLRAALNEPGCTVLVARAESTPEGDYFTDPPPELVGDPGPCIASPLIHGSRRGVRLLQRDATSDLDRSEVWPTELVARYYPPLCLTVWAAFRGAPREMPVAVRDDLVSCAGIQIPVWPGDQIYLFKPLALEGAKSKHLMLINWAGPTGTFPTYSLTMLRSFDKETLARLFRDKVVLVGSLGERKGGPVIGSVPPSGPLQVDQRAEQTMSGIELHANALDTLMQGRFIRPIFGPAAWGIILLASLVATFAFVLLGPWRAVGLLLAEVLGLFALGFVLIQRDVWLFSVISSSAAVLSGAITALWGHAQARQEAARLTQQAQAREIATAAIVHDLKQPLAAIAALVAAIRTEQSRGVAENGSSELLQLIQKQVEAALGDIDELLITSPERELQLSYQLFDVAGLARYLAVAHSMTSPVHEVQVTAPDEGVFLEADPRYIGRLLDNLMDNAIKYWPEGGTVLVSIDPGPYGVTIQVQDHGIGIPPDRLDTVFERFSRAVPQGVDIPGVGIGLFSVARIVEAHAGEVSVVSEVGKGSTFTVTIPRQPPRVSGTREARGKP